MEPLIKPDWPSPPGVRSLITTRQGGGSKGCYHSLNLGAHVGDDPASVEANRDIILQSLPAEPCWLSQVHGTYVLDVPAIPPQQPPVADASYTSVRHRVCAVLTADCLPLLLCSETGDEVAAVHAGWRGMASGIIAQAVSRFQSPPEKLLVYLGPAISAAVFQVGKDVRDVFIQAARERVYATPVEQAFSVCREDKTRYYADLYGLARSELIGAGVSRVYGAQFCTYQDESRFYSYRRDGTTGRMASLIWLA